MGSPLASAVYDDACLLRRERHPDGHLAELDEPRARRLIVLEWLLHSSPVQMLPPQPGDRRSTRRLLRSDVAIASPDALSLPRRSRLVILRERLLPSLE